MIGALGVAFPDIQDAKVLGRLRFCSVSFGRQEGLWHTGGDSDVVGFDICETGLRVFEWTPIGRSGTFFARWNGISTELSYWLRIFASVQLVFRTPTGDTELGVINISKSVARKIAGMSDGRLILPEGVAR